MKTLICTLVSLPILATIAAPQMLTAQDVKQRWLQALAYEELAASKQPPEVRAKEMERIANVRAIIKNGEADTQAQKAAVLANAKTLRESGAQPGVLPPLARMPDDEAPDSAQLRHQAEWASHFGGNATDPAMKQRYANDIAEYNKAVARDTLQKARSLAVQYEQMTGNSIVLAENDPAKLSAQIEGMSKAIAEVRRKQALDAETAAQVAHSNDDVAWQLEQLQRQIQQQAQQAQAFRQFPPLR